MQESRPSGGKLRFGMDLVATVAAVVGCALLVWTSWDRILPPGPRVPKAPISLEGATFKGNPAAEVVLVEFSDYMCPYCKKAEATLEQVVAKYVDTGRVQLAFRHNPLEQLHPGATKASEAALCAGRSGKFWEMHQALFSDPTNVDEPSLIGRAAKLSLDVGKFTTCLDGEVAAQVRHDVAQAGDLGLAGTPAFLVGRRDADDRVRVSRVLNGAKPLDAFEDALDEALRAPRSDRRGIAPLLFGAGVVVSLAVWAGARIRRISVKGGQ